MTQPTRILCTFLALATAGVFTGCQSPYRADRGALWGGLGGAGVGAIIGNQTGDAGAGAAIGAAVGTLTGAAVGDELDRIEASNRAAIEQQLGRQVRPGAVTMDEVIAMSQAGVGERLIVNHIQARGVIQIPSTGDLITLKQAGVPDGVVAVMQNPPTPAAKVVRGPTPVIVEEYHYGHPRPRYIHHRYHPHRRHNAHWGVQIHN
jgi:hypothetical protein